MCVLCRKLQRVSDGIRTHDRLDHNQELYQLSYAHHGDARSLAPRPRAQRARAGHRWVGGALARVRVCRGSPRAGRGVRGLPGARRARMIATASGLQSIST